jgi:hypothetical protein
MWALGVDTNACVCGLQNAVNGFVIVNIIDMLSTTLCVYISMAHKNPLFPCDIWIWSCLITFTVPHCYHVVDVQTMVYTHITGMFLRNTIQRIPRHWNLCRC